MQGANPTGLTPLMPPSTSRRMMREMYLLASLFCWRGILIVRAEAMMLPFLWRPVLYSLQVQLSFAFDFLCYCFISSIQSLMEAEGARLRSIQTGRASPVYAAGKVPVPWGRKCQREIAALGHGGSQ
eukprot:TRINITY_DN7099_c0_g1_i2.p2 TRINITY_DN7099_c0_g1~~TRINITY_DN7099_c0_g1_i2.p2  ORF type:complete len:127 (-),score=8.23 TRINITY_DN7099_c0_g1_i2:369-749(-)